MARLSGTAQERAKSGQAGLCTRRSDARDVGAPADFLFERSSMLVTGMIMTVPPLLPEVSDFRRMARPSGEGHRSTTGAGRPMSCELAFVSPCDLPRLRRERGSVGAASPAGSRAVRANTRRNQNRQDRFRRSGAASRQRFLPELWVPKRLRRLAARRNQIVLHRTRMKNEVHGLLQVHLMPKRPHADLFDNRGHAWLGRHQLPDDARASVAMPCTARNSLPGCIVFFLVGSLPRGRKALIRVRARSTSEEGACQ